MKRIEFKKMFELEDTHFWFVGKRLCIDSVLKKDTIAPKIRILDVGCGTGGTTVFLQKYGTVTGLEHNQYAYTCAKTRKLRVKMGSASNLPFKDGSFDMVTLLDVLYHQNIHDVGRVIKEVERVLVHDGRILITDSALPLLWSKHDEIMKGKRRFTIPELENELKVHKFTIIQSSYFFFLFFPLLVIKRKIIDSLNKEYQADVRELPSWINMCGILIMKIETFLMRYISLPFGSSLIIYAKKRS